MIVYDEYCSRKFFQKYCWPSRDYSHSENQYHSQKGESASTDEDDITAHSLTSVFDEQFNAPGNLEYIICYSLHKCLTIGYQNKKKCLLLSGNDLCKMAN